MANAIVNHFRYQHLHPDQPEIVEPFHTLAMHLDETLDEGPEKTVALRKLLEACDQAIRARALDVDNHRRDRQIKELTDVMVPHPRENDA